MGVATLRVYFRNLMMFVHDERGTDVWFLDEHPPGLITRTHAVDVRDCVVRFESDNKPLPDAWTTLGDVSGIADFNGLVRPSGLDDRIAPRHPVEPPFAGRVELRGSGTLSAPRSLHSFGALLEWSIPTAIGFPPVAQQELSELAIYEIEHLPTPIHAKIQRPDGAYEPVEIPVDTSGIAHVLLVAGELEKLNGGLVLIGDRLVIEEFEELHKCFDYQTQQDLQTLKALPSTMSPAGFPVPPEQSSRGSKISAFPYCPPGRVKRPGSAVRS
jgi:hypothetical protein